MVKNKLQIVKWVLPAIFLVVAAGVYAKRHQIEDWVIAMQKPDVSAVSYSNFQNPEPSIVPLDDDGGAVPVEQDEDPSDDDETVPAVTPESEEETPEPEVLPVEATTDLPAEFNLAIPFTSQAPKSNWEDPYQELCEEASALMAAYYYQGKPAGKVDSNEADADLLKMVDFENSFFGFYKDTTAAQTASLLEAYFQLNAELIGDPTIEDIKTAVAAGHPVIIPAAGRKLGNPNFTGEGPLYHVLLVKGYTADGFITNDPGTRLGADYFYSYDVLMNAIHDWNGGDVDNGQKIVIVVLP